MLRVPTSKIYRAFPFLDTFTDEQCELLMRRIRLSELRRLAMGVVSIVVFVGALVLMGALLAPLMLATRVSALVLPSVTTLLVPALIALLARDAMLRVMLKGAIRQRLDHVRCRACSYLLLGRTPEDGLVKCPECGRRQSLKELGAEAADLLATSTNAVSATAGGAK